MTTVQRSYPQNCSNPDFTKSHPCSYPKPFPFHILANQVVNPSGTKRPGKTSRQLGVQSKQDYVVMTDYPPTLTRMPFHQGNLVFQSTSNPPDFSDLRGGRPFFAPIQAMLCPSFFAPMHTFTLEPAGVIIKDMSMIFPMS